MRLAYPFAAIVGQEEMKLALMLAAVDWRLGVLLRGEKGSGKTTTARGFAALLPAPTPFVNVPIGATEDRLLGGLHLERALQGESTLKPGLLAEAHGGVLYVDEVNLLAAHLGDALLDAASSGVHVLEREGFSASQASEFVLLGSMNPEEGSLRPQLLDRFALSVEVHAPMDAAQRAEVVARRMRFERNAAGFAADWAGAEVEARQRIVEARSRWAAVVCPDAIVEEISRLVCAYGVRSLRADLAVMRAAVAHAALAGQDVVRGEDVEAVLRLALAHRVSRAAPPPPPPGALPPPPARGEDEGETKASPGGGAPERVFAPRTVGAGEVEAGGLRHEATKGGGAEGSLRGRVVRSRRTEQPMELDVRATLSHALRETGAGKLRSVDLHERVRESGGGTRYLLVVDSSGSHAVRERMRSVKGAAIGLLQGSFRRGDEVMLIVFRGTSAEVLLEATGNLTDAAGALEYLPTGGRTPLAHALALSLEHVTPSTVLVLMTDGHANYPLHGGDPWQEALALARSIECAAVLIDTEEGAHGTGQAALLAEAMGARLVRLDEVGAATLADVRVRTAERGSARVRVVD